MHVRSIQMGLNHLRQFPEALETQRHVKTRENVGEEQWKGGRRDVEERESTRAWKLMTKISNVFHSPTHFIF